MPRLIVAEFRKLFTTRLWLWPLLASVALTALYASLTIAFADNADTFTLPMTTPQGQRTLLAVGAAAAPFAAVLGAIGLTGEYRHRTITATFLATPRRGKVLAAKLVAYALAGVGYALAGIATTLAIALPWLAGQDIHLRVPGTELAATMAGVIAAVALFGLLGVGLGALLREQVASVVTLLAYLFVVENVLTNVHALNGWTRYLPGQAEEALIGSTLTNADLLPSWQGGLVLAGYGIALAGAGTALALHRDIT